MKITINPNSYYKLYYDDHYTIWCTNNQWAYVMARIYYKNKVVVTVGKYDKNEEFYTINRLQEYLNNTSIKIKEISKGDVFLELL